MPDIVERERERDRILTLFDLAYPEIEAHSKSTEHAYLTDCKWAVSTHVSTVLYTCDWLPNERSDDESRTADCPLITKRSVPRLHIVSLSNTPPVRCLG